MRWGRRRRGLASGLVHVVIYFGVFIVLHRMLRRWWYGAVGAATATILTLWTHLLAIGPWALTVALIVVAGLNGMVLRDQGIARR